ncbi:glucoamylase family protein [Dyadobacter psychrotolerans]|uniref:Beta-glucosidase n=1 Tax=Dyadobacter psychrotolerans TaxID=2541721 RepID=A0A4R5DGZ7_9BACT|nr:glucoamylase family protein [Dyadobacter psychrotolerans]TDE11124.1 beta-glucosidase [Dyadobacter psychrotolerans]
MKLILYQLFFIILIYGCKQKDVDTVERPSVFSLKSVFVNGKNSGFEYKELNTTPVIKLSFSSPIEKSTVARAIVLYNTKNESLPYKTTFENNANEITIEPNAPLLQLSGYRLALSDALESPSGGKLQIPVTISLKTAIDSTDKFPVLSNEDLLTLVQKQTFKYFWDFAHPVSGLARERNTSGDVVTSGGSGFGIMTIPVAIERKFITRAQGLERMQKIVAFLKDKTQKFHGAFPHWLNGATGAAIPFSAKDNGADLVETSLLMQGLLVSRQYFNGQEADETALRIEINNLWRGVEWTWFQKNKENVLYWHWSPDYGWEMNHQIKGWNESLITYVLAASSPTFPITKSVYENGWTGNGNFVNGKEFYGIKLPLGDDYGGPLFFAHYSFLGINPTGLTDKFTNYFTQNKNHSLINYNYCKTNPLSHSGYSNSCWGLTASDIPDGYNANSPTTDKGVIAPTAALSSFPYTPVESMQALKFFYNKLGDKTWGEYGFRDAFSMNQLWFADSYLAIDQGPIVIMIENYRSALLWNLFMSCPEVKTGMKNLGFQSPNL